MPSAKPTPLSFSHLGQRLRPPAIASLMSAALHQPGLLSLAAGFTDSSSLPVGDIGRAVRALEGRKGPPEHLQYGTNQGRPELRRLLARRAAESDHAEAARFEPDSVLVTNGSQQALYLATQVLCDPGDIVLVERPSYFVYLDMLKGKGARVLDLPEGTAGGLDLGALQGLLDQLKASGEADRLKIVYLESYFSNPTGRSRSTGDKVGLARVLNESGLNPVVIEDAAYRDLFFDSPFPASSFLSLKEHARSPVLYLGTLTKPYASGLKIGYGICTSHDLLQRMLWLKSHQDFGTANFNQSLLEEILLDGGLDRQLATLRTNYRAKMEALDQALRGEGLETLGWSWTPPLGGIYLWLQAPAGLDTRTDSPFWQACLKEGVLYVPGDLCYGLDSPVDRVRLSYGVLGPEDLARAASRFARAARKVAVPALGHFE